MKLTILGTGNATVTECYNTCFVISDNDRYFMVDGGGGNTILHQLKAAGLNWMDMRDIFVTHKHIDHLLGIIWMMRMILQNMNRGKYEGEATIYGHEEVIRILKEMAGEVLSANEKLTCCGDEPYNELEQKYAENSTWLLHEAFCLYGQADEFKPYEKHHSTVKDACEMAADLNVENLILYHTEDKNIEHRQELYLEEGKAYYDGNLFVPDDLDVIEL